MKHGRLSALLCALLAGCGFEPEAGGGLGFELFIQKAITDQLGGFQISVLPRDEAISCEQAQQKCLSELVTASKLVPVKDADGEAHPALIFAPSLRASEPHRTQEVVVRGLPAGKRYSIFIEAFSQDAPPRLLGTSPCNYVDEVRTGMNDTLFAQPITAYQAGPVACDPRFEK